MNCIRFVQIHTSDILFCSNSSPILELSVKFASQICYENTNTSLDGAYLADFGIDIRYDNTTNRDMYIVAQFDSFHALDAKL